MKPLKFGDVEWVGWDALGIEQRKEAVALWRGILPPRRATEHYSFAIAKSGGNVVMVGRYEGPADAPEYVECDTCDGKGSFKCDDCDGTGETTEECDLGYEHEAEHEECDGTGSLECGDCNGTGSEET